MSINLSKGSKINLNKAIEESGLIGLPGIPGGSVGLNNVMVGLGWDPVKTNRLFSISKAVDCDAFCITLHNGKVLSNDDLIYFGHKTNAAHTIAHMGDNLTGEGEGDDEQIRMLLNMVDRSVDSIVIGVNIFSGKQRGQNFDRIQNAFVRIADIDHNFEICRYNLTSELRGCKDVSMVFGVLVREGNAWHFNAMPQPVAADSIEAVARRFK